MKKTEKARIEWGGSHSILATGARRNPELRGGSHSILSKRRPLRGGSQFPFYLVKKAALVGRLPFYPGKKTKPGISWKRTIFYPILSCQKRRPFRGGSHSILATGGIQNLWVLHFCQDRMAAAPHLEVLNPFYPGKRRNPEYPEKKSMKSDGKKR